jgi:iron complex outermembrane recepter protein
MRVNGVHLRRARIGARVSCYRIALCFAVVLLAGGAGVSGQDGIAPASHDLSKMSIEDLMDIQVTSVSKKEQKMSQAAAAVFVITQEDIRRSAATNIPDLLRMVPGMDVSQIDANTWAISARGFNNQFSNKLLVLIDGRAVYTPLLSGVNWDTQDVVLEDIDRIEVIRGPGGTLWGANAVNGVINILTKKAADTQGGLLKVAGGTDAQALGVAQYGGKIGSGANYRIFTKFMNRDSLPELDGTSGDDRWSLFHGGFRTDAAISPNDSLIVQGDLYSGNEGGTIIHLFSIDPPVIENQDVRDGISGGNILGRWSHTFSSRSGTEFQFYFDDYKRTGPESIETRRSIDFDFSHHWAWGSRQGLVWGAGYRQTWSEDTGTIDQSFVPSNPSLHLLNVFAQDTVTLLPERLFLTAGSKIENGYYTGFGIEPTVRLAWTPSGRVTVWSAVSRAERAPGQRDAGLVAPLAAFPDPAGSGTPVEVILFGNPHFLPEHVLAYEAGLRAEPNERVSIDVSTYFNRYDHLQTVEPGAEFLQAAPVPARFVIPLTFGNLMYGTTEGAELSVNWKLADRWTLSPGYAFLEMHLHTKPSSQDDSSVVQNEGSSPQHQAQLRSHVDLPYGLSWDTTAYFVGALPAQGVASYTRIDTQLRWKLAESAELSVAGQNLVQDHHLESMDTLTLVNSSLIKRSAYVKITWRFP